MSSPDFTGTRGMHGPQRNSGDIMKARSCTSTRTLSRQARGLLAGGPVRGLGAAITLAAWNDSEFATTTGTAAGDFTSGIRPVASVVACSRTSR